MATTDERKLVTVLFADVAGSTELTTRHDPEPLRALLSAYFDEMRQQIEAFGGTVEKYAGDAARLQTAGDGIMVSEATQRLLAAQLEAEPRAPIALKGFPQPVTADRVRALQVIERRGLHARGLSSPVVGREREQAMLAGCLEDLRRGRGQVVVLVGEAGIGKSRLKIELRENLPEGIRWLEGRCQSYTQSTSYAPIAQVLRAAMGLGLTDAPAIARTKLRAAVTPATGAGRSSRRSVPPSARTGCTTGRPPSLITGEPSRSWTACPPRPTGRAATPTPSRRSSERRGGREMSRRCDRASITSTARSSTARITATSRAGSGSRRSRASSCGAKSS